MAELGRSTGVDSSSGAPSDPAVPACPPWCVTRHGVQVSEENWVHLGAPLLVADDLRARLCMSIEPLTGAKDGPYFLIGSTEYTLADVRELASSLIAAADAACSTPVVIPDGPNVIT